MPNASLPPITGNLPETARPMSPPGASKPTYAEMAERLNEVIVRMSKARQGMPMSMAAPGRPSLQAMASETGLRLWRATIWMRLARQSG